MAATSSQRVIFPLLFLVFVSVVIFGKIRGSVDDSSGMRRIKGDAGRLDKRLLPAARMDEMLEVQYQCLQRQEIQPRLSIIECSR